MSILRRTRRDAPPLMATSAPEVGVGSVVHHPRLSSYLRSVPLARRTARYFISPFDVGAFEPASADVAAWRALAVDDLLELSAGQAALWASAVAASGAVKRVHAADLQPPSPSCDSVWCIALNNSRLKHDLLASRLRRSHTMLSSGADDSRSSDDDGEREVCEGVYDLVFGAHTLCTCTWVCAPHRFAAVGLDTQCNQAGAPATCGGVRLDTASVDAFVGALKQLLRPGSGVALFDQEGGWPWGLERRLRAAATRHGLHFYVRRGPGGTNWDYIFSERELDDDVSIDPLQRDARALDAALCAVGLLSVSLLFDPEATAHALAPLFASEAGLNTRRALALGLAARLLLPLFDVLTLADLLDRLRVR
eukprot:CAMPEP_0183341072 /NCGR_PEP_ID=MMETSP0164_2-20130417/7404_1 /TAXON_ID=221442 /ORGANISM="Coccolithus pelagicus ssp braarudi, Strain PLY182g" /LENGTH=364 /DNA_ID=CAMNT_0025511303 /DNA_START=289 /DNA_END=1383 /DNA_ORIENTATION=+